MVFSSTLFLFLFLPVNLLLYYAIPSKYLTAKNLLLLCGSLIFYAWGEPVVILVMLASIAVNYAMGLAIDKHRGNRRLSRLILLISIIFNIGMLGYFKYASFIIENINGIFSTTFSLNVTLPIGISFFTFQIMSYVIDVYYDRVKPQRQLFNLALYISFFPQLIAGPIVRYIDIETQLANREHNLERVASGFQRFITGLAKKVIIANQVAIFADHAFSVISPACVTAWLGLVCYTIQIYFDFSGYSDMAIGLGRMFGFEFLENFNYPYISRTVQEFWRRWHISLSGWFRDYLYIPLGGNRKGVLRTYINLLIVFAVTGLWHGASWSFVIWGLYHGAFLIAERGTFGQQLKKIPSALTRIYTMLVVLIGWVFFRADTIPKAFAYIRCMFDFRSGGWDNALANMNIFILLAVLLGVVLSIPIVPIAKHKLYDSGNHFSYGGHVCTKQVVSYASIAVSLGMLWLSIIFITGSAFNPFLYFRF